MKIKKFLTVAFVFFLFLLLAGCSGANSPVKIDLPKDMELVNATPSVKTAFTNKNGFITITFGKKVELLNSGNALLGFGSGIWEKVKIKTDKNDLIVNISNVNNNSYGMFALVIPKTSVRGLEKDIYLQLSYRFESPKVSGGVVPYVISADERTKTGIFCNASLCNLSKDVFLNEHKPFEIGNKTELRNGDSFEILSECKDSYRVKIRYIKNGKECETECNIPKKYVEIMPQPLNKTTHYFSVPEKLRGYIIEGILSRKELSEIKYVPYFPRIIVESSPWEPSVFELLNHNIFPLSSEDIGVLELSNFELGLRKSVHPPSFDNLKGFTDNELGAILGYEKFFKESGENMISDFVFPKSLAGIRKNMRELFDKDVNLSIIYISHIKELKHGKIAAQQLNSLVLDLANNIGETPEEKQKIEDLFHYPLQGNVSETDINNVLDTNSNAWLYLLNTGNSEVSGAIEKEVKRILNR